MDLAVEANARGRYTIFPTDESATVPKDRFGAADLDRLSRTPREIRREVEGLLAEMAPFPSFVLSTGCDLPQETPPQNIRASMDAARAGSGGGPGSKSRHSCSALTIPESGVIMMSRVITWCERRYS